MRPGRAGARARRSAAHPPGACSTWSATPIKFTQRGEVVRRGVLRRRADGGRACCTSRCATPASASPPRTLRPPVPAVHAGGLARRRAASAAPGLGLSIVRTARRADGRPGRRGQRAGTRARRSGSRCRCSTARADAEPRADRHLRRPARAAGRRQRDQSPVLASQLEHAGYEWRPRRAAPSGAGDAAQPPGRAARSTSCCSISRCRTWTAPCSASRSAPTRDIARARLMLLTSLDRTGDMQRFAQLGLRRAI